MTASNGSNGSSPPHGTGRRFVRAFARVVLTVAIVTVAVAPLARPAGAQEIGTVAASEVAAPSAPAASAMPATADALMPPAPTAAPKKAAHDLTPIGMFLAADPIVQSVMVLLAAASVVVWVILLVRGLGLFLAKRRLRAALHALGAAEGLADASARVRSSIAARLLLEAERELEQSRGLPSDGIKERVLMALERVEAGVGRRMAAGTGILATVGSTGPFVGLFGTVWGIMRSFIGIANANTTNLAVVAPGIAEALLATGIGLVAAIPAVVIYNVLARSITGYRALSGDAVALIMRHLSRDLDRRESRSSGSAPSSIRAAAE